MADLEYENTSGYPEPVKGALGAHRVIEGNYSPLGYEQITDLAAPAKALTVPLGARIAHIQAEGDDIRYRDDGIDPTATVGFLLADGRDFPYSGDLAAIKFIQVTAGGKLNVHFYG